MKKKTRTAWPPSANTYINLMIGDAGGGTTNFYDNMINDDGGGVGTGAATASTP